MLPGKISEFEKTLDKDSRVIFHAIEPDNCEKSNVRKAWLAKKALLAFATFSPHVLVRRENTEESDPLFGLDLYFSEKKMFFR